MKKRDLIKVLDNDDVIDIIKTTLILGEIAEYSECNMSAYFIKRLRSLYNVQTRRDWLLYKGAGNSVQKYQMESDNIELKKERILEGLNYIIVENSKKWPISTT